MNFRGIFPPVITPFKDDGAIDYNGFAALIERLVAMSVHGIVVGGTTGECYAQTAAERVNLMRIAREVINGRIPLIVGVGAIRTEDCIEFGLAARRHGADAILMPAPYYAAPTPLELINHALAVDRAVNLPIMLYNYPGRTGTVMRRPFFERVGRSPNFAAVKESTGDINQLHMLAREFPHIELLCGMDDQALEFFAWGAAGWVCAGGNCLPAEHLALYQAVAVENDIARGRRIMSALMPFMRILEQGGKLIQIVKHACALQGLPAGSVRRPLGPLFKDEKRELEITLRVLKQAMARLEAGGRPGRSQAEDVNVINLKA